MEVHFRTPSGFIKYLLNKLCLFWSNMPRKPRFNLIGIPQHAIQRGNNRDPCFYVEEDYRRYLDDLQECASMVNHPGEYKWSSYHANAQDRDDVLIDPHHLYLELGENPDICKSAYRELFRHHMDSDTLHEIRESLNHELVLGRSYFKDKIEEITARQTRLGVPGRPRVEDEAGVYWVGY